MRPSGVWVLLVFSGILALANGSVLYAQQIGPPFGLHWAEGEKEVARMLQKSGARIIGKVMATGKPVAM